MKPTQKQVNIGDKFETTTDLFAMTKHGDAFGMSGNIPLKETLVVVKPRVMDEGVNCIKYTYKGDVYFSYWIHFKTNTKRV
jgi:hypothetical protein